MNNFVISDYITLATPANVEFNPNRPKIVRDKITVFGIKSYEIELVQGYNHGYSIRIACLLPSKFEDQCEKDRALYDVLKVENLLLDIIYFYGFREYFHECEYFSSKAATIEHFKAVIKLMNEEIEQTTVKGN